MSEFRGNDHCDHKWNSGDEVRFCCLCGQVRTFPTGKENGKAVWQGVEDQRVPTELPAEDKSTMAHLAREIGLKEIVEYINIPITTLRAWVGTYCRGMAPILKPPVVKRAYHRKVAESPEVKTVEPEVEPEPVLEVKPPVEVTKPEVFRSHDSLKHAPAVSQALADLYPAKVDLQADLPPFPAFSETWDDSVKMEWISVYLELVKLRGK